MSIEEEIIKKLLADTYEEKNKFTDRELDRLLKLSQGYKDGRLRIQFSDKEGGYVLLDTNGIIVEGVYTVESV